MSDKYMIMYMGHAQGGRDDKGFQDGAEFARDKNNHPVLVELVEQQVSQFPFRLPRKFVPGPSNTFSHFGLIVDDLAAAQHRFDSPGVDIIKCAGGFNFSPETRSPVLAAAWAFDDLVSEQTQAASKAVLPALMTIEFKNFGIVANPDSSLFEAQQFVSDAL
ncbi:uncharacterized protein CC84DRAFT_1218266 [Paraphaeosphaeria sporulosa]|uniref:Uncharacterized protein n=1 Tax=Paraphaeosphaeria sporulosa TaxID=1460663 RepID=A0A177CDR7_9PLEO|nr:uncharacterized protein CC84DRAFT_1218266 [Paraphaeosphaeria sporulosa]OAG04850.1 hypothetical protein CC84DRAFT_1218266 [Paraphaeosphaeria sporulosa]